MIYEKEIIYGTSEHQEMIALRNRILREPWGLSFSDEDLKKERNDFLLCCCNVKDDKIVGCCVLTPLNDNTLQLRQMAVESFRQGKGIGSKILFFAEEIAKKNQYKYIYLHARKEAVAFYKKNGYDVEGEEFIEVGMPHYEMLKKILL
ncbi:GNAT family N-acetyltransferase [Dysgonomonas sp. 25]|uniref:GNAT family N-acetyltransferase n=1 Tax=Dysgonomonas sp. 25 TaxID=2302933 RepID=UPI0013D12FE6|nr:GNAT family N-acetyltransferase [Dysgonomonas sp. 25]NDV68188.1 GNAT family N-acetyltransferase [Dysgonomonas sp. 25]